MRIIKIDAENLEDYAADLVAISNEFLGLVCEQESRGEEEGRKVLEQMVANSPTTVVMLVEDAEGNPIGMSYGNYGTGYSCGGVYFWLNGIYIREAAQQRGYGLRLLEHMIEDGKRRGMTLFICSRAPENDASRRLFQRAGFEQHPSTGMMKTFD